MKVNFTLAALEADDPFAHKVELSSDRIAALEWQAKHSATEILAAREAVIADIEAKGREFHADGSAKAWLANAEPSVQKVAETVNGPLLSYLANKAMHVDVACAELLRTGAPLFGRLESCGNGEVKLPAEIGNIDDLHMHCSASNEHLLKLLRNDPWEEELHRLTLEDAALGRMSFPVSVSAEHMRSLRLNQRFGVEQGLKPCGKVKVRAVDNMSWESSDAPRKSRKRTMQSVNGCSEIPEKMRHHHIDDLAIAIRMFIGLMGCIPGIFKADVKQPFAACL